MIPVSDPRAGYRAHREEFDTAVRRVLEGGWYILGEEVRQFEKEFAAFIGQPYAVGVSSGTAALHLALRALGLGPGAEVLAPTHTAVATVAAIEMAGAEPVLLDVDEETFTLRPDQVDAAIGPKTRAVIAVHLYGHPAPMPDILEIARRRGLAVIEDCAQAHGAALEGRKVGTWGDAAAFSFYPTKNLGAFGDGGAVVTGRRDVFEKLQLLRQYGWRQRYISEIPGFNSRLDELQAGLLRIKLRHLEADNARRRALAQIYNERLAGHGIRTPVERPGAFHVYHQYTIRTGRRDELRKLLQEHGIATAILYPVPVHLQLAYRGRVRTVGNLAVAEQLAGDILCLPMFPELREEDVRRVVEAVAAACNALRD